MSSDTSRPVVKPAIWKSMHTPRWICATIESRSAICLDRQGSVVVGIGDTIMDAYKDWRAAVPAWYKVVGE